MASLAHPARPADPSAAPAARKDDLAWFKLAKPVALIEGEERKVEMLGMRALTADDIARLDDVRGRPVELAQTVVAILCELTLDQVRQIDLQDFAPMSEDALWQVQHALAAMGLTPRDYIFLGVKGAAV